MIIRAIDVGYGNTKFCHGDKGCDHFPSIATLTMKSGIGLSAGGTIKRDVIEVESDGSNYLVGKDGIETLSARDDRGRSLNASYAETAQHLALFRGALAYLDVPEIDVIVSGLPVKNYAKNKIKMTERLKGKHSYPNGSKVIIKDAWVIPQPMGGFIDYFMNNNKAEDIGDIKSLTIDVGYFSIDWLVCQGLKLNEERSDGNAGGMSTILNKLSQLISIERNVSNTDIDIIDKGIRNNFKSKIQGKEYDFSHLMPKLDAYIKEAIQSVLSSVGSLDDIDVIVLVGGGANTYKNVIQELLNNRDIIVPDNSIYSNVNGFYLAGNEKFKKY